MSSFPICVETRGETVILAGSGRMAEEKLEKLLLFEAHILLFAEGGFEGLSYPQVTLHSRRLTEEDLEQNPLFVVAAEEEREKNRAISRWCRERKIPVNVVDDPELCSFTFPALIRRGEATISISTSGKSPAAAAVLRQRLEQAVPERLEEILDWSAELRSRLKQEITDAERRKRILRSAVAAAMERGRPLSAEELKQWTK